MTLISLFDLNIDPTMDNLQARKTPHVNLRMIFMLLLEKYLAVQTLVLDIISRL